MLKKIYTCLTLLSSFKASLHLYDDDNDDDGVALVSVIYPYYYS